MGSRAVMQMRTPGSIWNQVSLSSASTASATCPSNIKYELLDVLALVLDTNRVAGLAFQPPPGDANGVRKIIGEIKRIFSVLARNVELRH